MSFWRLDVTLYLWFICLFAMKCVELIHIYSKTWWEEFRATDDSGISLVSNPSTSFSNNLLSHAEIYNKWMEILCIIVDGRLGTKMIRALT